MTHFSYLNVIFERGGLVMYPLFLCTFLFLFLLIERLSSLNKKKLLSVKVLNDWKEYLNSENSPEPTSSSSLLNIILHTVFKNLPTSIERLKEKMMELADQEKFKLEKGLVWMNIITVVAPLFGLLGTAIGMIEVFNQLSLKQNTSLNLLSKGISEALFTTVTGLTIAIPALITYHLLQRKIDFLMMGLEGQLNQIFDLISLKHFSDSKNK